jgi:hypothetical protein
LDGLRRIKAYQKLGFERIPAYVKQWEKWVEWTSFMNANAVGEEKENICIIAAAV